MRSATVPRRSTSHTVPCLVDASPRVMTTSCPSKDCGSRGANRQENEEAFAHVLSSSLKMCASAEGVRGCGGDAARGAAIDRETRNSRDAPRDVPCSAPTAAVGEENDEEGARESGGRGSEEGRACRQTVASEKTTPRVRAGNARVCAFRRSRRSIVFRERTSRTPGIAIASLEDCFRVTHASWPPIVRSRDAFASCKLCRTMNDAAFPGWRAAACDASATDRSARPAEDVTRRDCLTAPCGFLGVPRLARAARAQ